MDSTPFCDMVLSTRKRNSWPIWRCQPGQLSLLLHGLGMEALNRPCTRQPTCPLLILLTTPENVQGNSSKRNALLSPVTVSGLIEMTKVASVEFSWCFDKLCYRFLLAVLPFSILSMAGWKTTNSAWMSRWIEGASSSKQPACWSRLTLLYAMGIPSKLWVDTKVKPASRMSQQLLSPSCLH